MVLAIPLIVLLTLLVGYGIVGNAKPVSGGFVSWLTKTLETASGIGFVTASAALDLTKRLSHALGIHYDALVGAGVRWVGTLANYVNVVGYWTLYWPIELLHVVSWLVKSHIPHAINARTKPIAQTAANAEAQAKAAAGLAHTIPKTAKGHSTTKEVTIIQHVAMPYAKDWDWIHNHWKALTSTVLGGAAIGLAYPGAVDLPVPWGRTIKGIRKRLSRIESHITARGIATALVGVGALALLRTLRCPNFLKYGPRLCNIRPNLLDAIFLGTAVLGGQLSIVTLGEALLEVEDELISLVSAGFSELSDL